MEVGSDYLDSFPSHSPFVGSKPIVPLPFPRASKFRFLFLAVLMDSLSFFFFSLFILCIFHIEWAFDQAYFHTNYEPRWHFKIGKRNK